ncbi:hypothetical protein QYE76_034622 [Lolium multiflorum]|uniref:Uncharacterized protein n=1 Tax=Lolium multiflorum TaxID=4521 RepID=A0AAD8R0X4_LOLMU|nr:hypothetical protein QYE76_034622 [Lolium multiflorum]
MDAWHMVEKFRAEIIDSSSDDESDQSAHTLATTAASMIHEFTSNPGPQHRGSVKGRKTCRATEISITGLLPGPGPFPARGPGRSPRCPGLWAGPAYDKPYYLADGIYPDWDTLVKTVRNPNSEKTRRFAKMQEACRKDVERGFVVLQARWAIVRHPARTWSLKTMHEVMTCCVIMHNMIVENERPDGRNENHREFQVELVAPIPGASTWEDYLHMNVEVTNDTVSKQLQTDLIEHQWTMAGHEDHA